MTEMAEYIKREDVLKILSEKNAPWNGYVKVKELPTEPVIEPSVYVTNIKKLVKDYDALEDQVNTLEGKLPKWIPVTERLPEERINPNTRDFEYVLCVTIWGDVRPFKYGTPIGQKEAHFWNGAGYVDAYVTHWMPLPEPPKDGEEDA